MTGGFHALDRALAAAGAASQAGRWDEAIALWRPWLAETSVLPIAATCIAEAALHARRFGLADQMLAQLDPVPDFLSDLERVARIDAGPKPDGPDEGERVHRSLAQNAEEFLADHPMGPALSALGRLEPLSRVEDRQPLLSRLWPGPRASRVTRAIDRLFENEGASAVHAYVAKLLETAGRTWRSREVVYRLIFGLHKAGYYARDPVMQRALARWDALARGDAEDLLSEARLQRILKHREFARLLLRRAVEEATGPGLRALARRRLAAIDDERGRWLDDADLLDADDFPAGGPREIFRELRQHSTPVTSASAELLEAAFDFVLDALAKPYEAQNRLLMVGNSLACGGMERVMANSYRHFREGSAFDAVDMALLDFEEGKESAHYAADAGVSRKDVVLLDPGGETGLPFALLPGSWKERCRKLHDHVVATRPRVIHAWNDLTGLLAAYAGLLAGCPKIIVHFHHGPSQPLSSLAEPVASYPYVYRQLLKWPECEFIFCSDAAARDYAEWWRVPCSERFRTIYNGFEWPQSSPDQAAARKMLGLPEQATIIGTIGRLSPVKQPLSWAEAAIDLAGRRGDAYFVWAGDGQMRGALAARFEAAGHADRLALPGQVDNVADWLATMDIFWQTSASEGLPNALIEAQFAGVPVIAFDVGGVAETFVDGESGLLVPPGDIAALADVTERQVENADWLGQASRMARRQAKDRFSAERFYGALAALYASESRKA